MVVQYSLSDCFFRANCNFFLHDCVESAPTVTLSTVRNHIVSCAQKFVSAPIKTSPINIMMSSVLLSLLILNLLPHICKSEEDPDRRRHIYIVNFTGRPIGVYWIHPETRERQVQHHGPHLPNGDTLSLNSFKTHEFELIELPSLRTNMCLDGGIETCRKEYFTMDERKDQVVYVRAGFELDHTVVEVSPSEMATWLGTLAVIFQTALVLLWAIKGKKKKRTIKIKYRPPPPKQKPDRKKKED